jgi:protein involved in polysaccharide export with SLBB domain
MRNGFTGKWVFGWVILCFVLAGCAGPSGRAPHMTPYRPLQNRTVGQSSKAAVKPVIQTPAAAPIMTNRVVETGGGDDNQSRRLQAGDRLEINLRAIPNPENMKSVVDENGFLNFPFIGGVKVMGLTCSEAERLVEKSYVDGGIYRHITVIIVPPESEYAVQGEVLRPGPYPLTRDMTLMQALSRAGRFTDFADSTRVRLIRGKETLVVNVQRIEQNKEKDLTVKPGDVILVPKSWW